MRKWVIDNGNIDFSMYWLVGWFEIIIFVGINIICKWVMLCFI